VALDTCVCVYIYRASYFNNTRWKSFWFSYNRTSVCITIHIEVIKTFASSKLRNRLYNSVSFSPSLFVLLYASGPLDDRRRPKRDSLINKWDLTLLSRDGVRARSTGARRRLSHRRGGINTIGRQR